MIATGSLSLLDEGLKQRILVAYVKIGAANQTHAWSAAQEHVGQAIYAWAEAHNARRVIAEAHDASIHFLARE